MDSEEKGSKRAIHEFIETSLINRTSTQNSSGCVYMSHEKAFIHGMHKTKVALWVRNSYYWWVQYKTYDNEENTIT